MGCFGFNVAMLGVCGSLVVVNWWLERKCETQEGWGEKKKRYLRRDKIIFEISSDRVPHIIVCE